MNVGLGLGYSVLGSEWDFRDALLFCCLGGGWPCWLSGECIMDSGGLLPPGLKPPFSFC